MPQAPDPTKPEIFQRLDRSESYPYRMSEYARRAAWNVVQATIFRFSPKRSYGWRRFLLRLFGARVAATSRVRPSTRVMHPWLLAMGESASIGDEAIIYNLGPIAIGDHSLISQRTHLCAGSHDYTQPHLPLTRPPITIGSGVWVCAEAFIGPGVTVGDNSIVAARAVVVRDVPPGVIVGGNPATVIKPRPM